MKLLGRVRALVTRPSGLAGGFLGAALVAAQPGGIGILGLGFGWLYGLAVSGLIHLFRVPPGAYPLVGLLAGPVPFALLLGRQAEAEPRGLVWVGAFAGLLLGLVEWAHARHAARSSGTWEESGTGGDPLQS